MKKVSAKHVNTVLKREFSALHSTSSSDCRLEWITIAGGVYNEPHDTYTGATETVNIDTAVTGMWSPVMRDQRERIDLEEQTLSIDQLGFWFFSNGLNLSSRNDLVILQKDKEKYHSGSGTGAAAIWTLDVDPEFDDDEWLEHWLVFADRRFKIIDNNGTSVTVDLTSGIGGSTLPAGPVTGEIMGLVEWYPVRRDLGFSAGVLSPINSRQMFQSIFCSRIPVTGR
jgi:hypothetical protein